MTKIKHLKLNKICRTFAFREIAVLAQFVKEEEFKKGNTIFKEGESGEKLYLLVKGEVGIKSTLLGNGDDFILNLTGGEFFGELSIFGAGPRKVSALAIADNTILFSLSKNDFNTLCTAEPFVCYKLTMEMIGVFSSKLKESSDELKELFTRQKGAF